MIKYSGDIEFKRPFELFEKYNVSEKNLKRYKKMIDEGREDEAVDDFIFNYMVSAASLYTSTMQYYLRIAQEGELNAKDKNNMIKTISILSLGIVALLNDNFSAFTINSYSGFIFDMHEIQSLKVQKTILDTTLAQFKTLTEGAMNETQAEILKGIRQVQQRFIIKNQQIAQTRNIDLAPDVKSFKDELRKMYPDYYTAMEEGKILKSKKFLKNGDETVIQYGLDNYSEMSVRTTILNVDRTSVEVVAEIDQVPVVEYYKRDNRPLKTGKEREICKTILGSSYMGKNILALDDTTAAVLGVMSLSDAKASGAMGPYCRHSIMVPSNTYLSKIAKALKEAA